MKILIASGIFTPEVGGPATYIPNIAKEFLALGHEPVVLTYSDNSEYPSDQNLPYQVNRIKRAGKLSNYWRYYKTLKSMAKHCDIIYAFDHFSAGLPAALIAKKLPKPLFIRVGGDFIWERYLDNNNNLVTMRQFYEQGLHQKAEGMRFRLIKWVFSQATGIIFTTEFQKQIFVEHYSLISDKLHLVANPIVEAGAIEVNRKINQEIIFAGRFINKNNIQRLIEAWQQIKSNAHQLVLIGDGPLKNHLSELIKNYSNIKIEASLDRQALRQRMARAYLVAFPSLTDISPNAMLECLSVGTPFISTEEIGFDWLKDKVKLFNPQNSQAMATAISDLLDQNKYNAYKRQLAGISYHYSYNQEAIDTLKIFSN